MEIFVESVSASIVATIVVYLVVSIFRRFRGDLMWASDYKIYYYDFCVTHDVARRIITVEKSVKIKPRSDLDHVRDFPSIPPGVAKFCDDEFRAYVEDANNVRQIIPHPITTFPPLEFANKPRAGYKLIYEFNKGTTYTVCTIATYKELNYFSVESGDASGLTAIFDVPLYFGVRGTRVDLALQINSPERLNAHPFIARIERDIRRGGTNLERKNPMRNFYIGSIKQADNKSSYSLHYRWAISEAQLVPTDRSRLAALVTTRIDQFPDEVMVEKGANLDADAFLRRVLSHAKFETIILDNHVSPDFMEKVYHLIGRGHVRTIHRQTPQTSPKLADKIVELSARRKAAKIGSFTLINFSDAHARMMIVDRKLAYVSTASFKDLGNKLDYIRRLDEVALGQRIASLVAEGLIPADLNDP